MTEAVEFLRLFAPTGPWDLVAFECDGEGRRFKRFMPGEEAAAESWLGLNEQQWNIYFHVNPSQTPDIKAQKTDISEVRFLHIDIDPVDGSDWNEEQGRLLDLLTTKLPTGVPKPSFILNSGNGRWGLWKLETPVALGGDRGKAEEVERYNRWLELKFDADACHDVSRVARLPGLTSWPNAKKRAAGREPKATSFIRARSEPTYGLNHFQQADAKKAKAASDGLNVDLPEDLPDVTDLEEQLVKPFGVHHRTCGIITVGFDADKFKTVEETDRSETVFYVVCELIRKNVPYELIGSMLLDEAFGISAHVLDQKSDHHRYVERQIERAATSVREKQEAQGERSWSVDESGLPTGPNQDSDQPPFMDAEDHLGMLDFMNSTHAYIGSVFGKTQISNPLPIPGTDLVNTEFVDPQVIKNLYCNQKVIYRDKDDKAKLVAGGLGSWWINSEQRRTYKTTGFMTKEQDPTIFNLWKGFAVEPAEGNCDVYLEHLRDNVCDGNLEYFEYLWQWMARAIQYPELHGRTAIVLCGSKGTGKSAFVKFFGKLFHPNHYMTTASAESIVGRFNDHLLDKVIVFADEAFFAGDPRDGKLKTLITEDTFNAERKHGSIRDFANHTHLLMASNSPWVVRASAEERRYFVLNVADHRMRDNAYFESMRHCMENEGGLSALLHKLMNVDLSAFDPYEMPRTEALLEQMERSMECHEDWWLGKLQDGSLQSGGWPELVIKKDLYNSYLQQARDVRAREPLSERKFSEAIFEWGVTKRRQTRAEAGGDNRKSVFVIPPLQNARKLFGELYGIKEWPVLETHGPDRRTF